MNEPLSILLPYQRRWLADQSQVKVSEKSRRIGITWTEAADRALGAATGGRAGMDGWYIGYNKDMALEFIEAAARWARRFNRAAEAIEEIVLDDERSDILAYRIRFASGHKIVALSSRPSNLRGKDGCAVIDEAAFHEDLPGLLKAALAFTMWGGLVRIISTHNGAHNAFNELVSEIRAGRRPYSLHRTTFDEALADGLYRKICEQTEIEWSEEKQREWRQQIVDYYGDNVGEELFCIPRASSGAYLSSVLIEARMKAGIPILRWEMPAEFSGRPEAHRYSETQAWCDDNIAPALATLDPTLAQFFRRRLRPLGRPDRHLAAANRAGPDAADAVRRRAAQYPVSKPGAGALLYSRPAAALHRRRDGCARQRTIPGGDGGAALRRANRAGDAVGVVVSREYAALQGGVRGRHDRDSQGRRRLGGPSRDRARERRREDFGAARGQRRQGTAWRLGDGGGARVLRVARGSRARSHTFRRAGWGSGRDSRGEEIRSGRRRWKMRWTERG